MTVTRPIGRASVATPQVCRVGLSTKMPLKPSANAVAASGVVLARLRGVTWSRDVRTLDRVLARLRNM